MSPELINKIVELNSIKKELEEGLEIFDNPKQMIQICNRNEYSVYYKPLFGNTLLYDKIKELVKIACISELEKIKFELNNITC